MTARKSIYGNECRLHKDNYKGMSTAEAKAIADDQKAQALAKQQRQKEEAERDRTASETQDSYTLAWKAQQAEVCHAAGSPLHNACRE